MIAIGRNTTMGDIAHLVPSMEEGWRDRVRAAAVRDLYGEGGFYAMTVRDLTTVTSGDLRPLWRSGGRTLHDTERVEAFKVWIGEFAATLKRLTPPATPSSVRLQAGTMATGFEEGIYLFCRDYFGMHTFAEVDRLKVADYILARKDDYNRAMIEINSTKK